jgi:hypothetical protein
VWRARRYEVKRVVKRWRTPAGPGFRVQVFGLGPSQSPQAQSPAQESDMQKSDVIPVCRLTMEGGGLFDLQYIEVEDKWTLDVHTSIQEDQR